MILAYNMLGQLSPFKNSFFIHTIELQTINYKSVTIRLVQNKKIDSNGHNIFMGLRGSEWV